jgi:hypothetical protein
MIISDLSCLDSLSGTDAMYLYGGDAIAISRFSANAFGTSTNTSTFLRNFVRSGSGVSVATSSVRVSSTASGQNASVSSSASSASFAR